MCGIAGYRGLSDVLGGSLLMRMADTLTKRGPEDRDCFIHGLSGLCHTRLKIIDPEGGRQPLFNEDKTVCVVVNGEIYNFPLLREFLQKKGHAFTTRSDAEVLVHSYEENGVSFLDKLDGMFALALYDLKKDRLILARDRLGKKPLHYAFIDRVFYFASEIKALLTIPSFARNVSAQALCHYLILQYIPDNLCIFKGIDKLQPAEYCIVDNGKAPVKKRYWELLPDERKPPLKECRERIRALASEAVRKRMIADVPLGVFLSGGVDSSIVTALLSKFAQGGIKTYSIGFREERYSELKKARSIADKYGARHQEFLLGLDEMKDRLFPILSYFDEPLADPSALPFHFLCHLSKREITVALTGDGGDELFAGYQRYRLDELLKVFGRLPAFIPEIFSMAASLFKVRMEVPLGRNAILGLKRLTQAMKIPASAGILRFSSYFNEGDLAGLFKEEYLAGIDLRATVRWLASFYQRLPEPIRHLNRTLYTDLMTYAPGDYLTKADRMSMSNSLEIRCPFLDVPLAEYAFSLASSLKIRPELKTLLKEAFREDLTPEVLQSPKQGFTLPIGLWMKERWLALYRDLAAGPNSVTNTYFNRNKIDFFIHEHLASHNDHGKKLYALLCLEIWAKTWLQG